MGSDDIWVPSHGLDIWPGCGRKGDETARHRRARESRVRLASRGYKECPRCGKFTCHTR